MKYVVCREGSQPRAGPAGGMAEAGPGGPSAAAAAVSSGAVRWWVASPSL